MMSLNKIYIKHNGMERVIVIGFHAARDFIAISSGRDLDIRYISYMTFLENYIQDGN